MKQTFVDHIIDLKNKDICPCGSGKKYRDCCYGKNIEFIYLGENSKGKIIINNTSSNERYERMKVTMQDILSSFPDDSFMSISKALDYLVDIYKLVDKGYNDLDKYTNCKKGCDKCCSFLVHLTALEAENIRRYITKNFSSEKIKMLEEYILKTDIGCSYKSYNRAEGEELKALCGQYDFKCPFNDESGLCSIYSVRPLYCRICINADDNVTCGKNSENNRMIRLKEGNGAEILISLLHEKIKRYKNLFNPYGQISKSVNKTFFEWFKDGFDNMNLEGL